RSHPRARSGSCGVPTADRPATTGHPDCIAARIACPPCGAARVHSRAMPTKQQAPDLRILTPLRGIAALWVVVYHFGDQYLPALSPGPAGHLLGKGYLA